MTRPCAVLVVTPRLDAPGGIAAVVRTLLESGLGERYDCRVVETVGSGSAIVRGLRSVLGVLDALVAIERLPKGSIVHLHLSQGGSFVRKSLVARAARLHGHRVVLHIHGSRFHSYAAAKSRLVRVRQALEAADRVIVLSRTWETRIRTIAPAARTVVVENPVVIPQLPVASAHGDGVLFLGRLGERKGVPVLLEAVRVLQEQGMRQRITIAGDGTVDETRAVVATLPYPEDVDVPGWVELGGAGRGLLAGHGIFCLPSRDEGQPIALLEAMAHGMACIVTPVGGIPDTVTADVDALVVPVDDPARLAEAIASLHADASRRVRLGEAARETALRRFDARLGVDAIGRIYAELGCRPGDGETP